MLDPRRPYSAEELSAITLNAEAQQFIETAPDNWTIGRLRQEVREKFLGPVPLIKRLKKVNFTALTLVDQAAIRDAVGELAWAERLAKLRPVADLMQEAHVRYGRGVNAGPYRWVIFWRDSGYRGAPQKQGIVGRRQPLDVKFAGKFVGTDFEPLSASGCEPSHFTELPDGVL